MRMRDSGSEPASGTPHWPARGSGVGTLALVMVLVLGAGPTGATDLPVEDPPAAYDACLRRVETDPHAAFGAAVAWEGLGGGEPARHCAAVALFVLGEHAEAARRLETLAQESRQALPLRVDMLAQAGAAWLRAGRPGRATAVFDAVIALVEPPDSGLSSRLPGLLLDRATARADQGHDAEAARDLSRVLALRPGDGEALALRATTRRRMGDLSGATADADAVLARAPDHVGALLERGNVCRLAGDPGGAREAWMRVLAVAPDSPEAEAARANLARLDAAREGG